MDGMTLAGNSALKEQLFPRLEGGTLGHAYLISGPVGSGRHTLARLLSAAMVCTGNGPRPCGMCAGCRKAAGGIHPDITVLSGGEGKAITVDQVRALRADAFIRPNEAQRKVYQLEQADRLLPAAQNAMLKLLEEGPPYAAFLLMAENPACVLPTVRSRCEGLSLAPVSVPQAEQWLAGQYPDVPAQVRRQAALDCQGILGRAVEHLSGRAGDEVQDEAAQHLLDALDRGDEWALLEICVSLEKLDRQQFLSLLDELTVRFSGRLAGAEDRRSLLRGLELTNSLRQAAGQNVSSGHLAGWLCAGLTDVCISQRNTVR